MRERLLGAVGVLLLTAGSYAATGLAEATAAPAVPTRAAGTFVPLPPVRILDTRTGLGGTAPRQYGTTTVRILGVGNVPATGVADVVLNVTVVAPAAAGFLKVDEDSQSQAAGTNLDFAKGRSVANLVTTRVAADGKVMFISGANGVIQLVADVVGYFVADAA